MTPDEIIEMARRSGFTVARNEWAFTEMLVVFAKRVEEKATAIEREACANSMAKIVMIPTYTHGALVKLSDVVNAIRARGQA